MKDETYMDKPCAKCGKYKALALDCYENKQAIIIVKYYCMNCKHKGKRSSRIRVNEKTHELGLGGKEDE